MTEPDPPKILLSTSTQTTYVTVASESLCHYITDDELDRLGQMQNDPASQISLTAAGAFLGSLVPSFEAFGRFNSQVNPMGLPGLATLLVSVGSLAVALVTGFLAFERSKQKGNLSDRIKSRPRVVVQPN